MTSALDDSSLSSNQDTNQFSNYETQLSDPNETQLSDPTHIGPNAQVIWLIVGQEILDGDVGGGFLEIQTCSNFILLLFFFQIW